jgi:hypothetical protein
MNLYVPALLAFGVDGRPGCRGGATRRFGVERLGI